MAKDIIFTKLQNGSVLVTGTSWRQYTLSSMCTVRIDVEHDLVRVYMPSGINEAYEVADVLRVVSLTGVVTPINDVVTLFNTLKDVCFTNNLQAELGSTTIAVNANITNATIEIANDAGNPIPTTNSLLELDSTQQIIDNQSIITKLGTVTETAPTTDIASSGLNGRMQRISQRLTTLITNIGTPLQSGGSVLVSNASLPITATTLPLPTGASTSASQTSGNNSLASIDTKTPPLGQALATASAPVVLTAVQIATLTPLASVGVNNFPATQAVTGAFFQATQPISGTVATGGITDTQIRATPLPVSMSNTLALTDTQLRASAVLVTMSNTLALTDTQIRATALPVIVNADADNTATGTLSAALQTVTLNMVGKSATAVGITGTWVGTITFEGSVDGTNWIAMNGIASSTSGPQTTTTVNGLYRVTPGGLFQIRVIMTLFTSGTANIFMRSSNAVGGVFANQILPVTIRNNNRSVYSISTNAALTPAVVANKDIIKIAGGTSPIYIKRIIFSATTTSAVGTVLNIVKYSSLPTGGTATVLPSVALSSANVGATTTASVYTTTTTSDGTAIGTIFSNKILIPVATTSFNSTTTIDFTTLTNEGLVLLNANENIGIQIALPPTGLSINVTIIYES